MNEPVVAVIDIGSNSIKLLVATREPTGSSLVELAQRTEETRIGTGITENPPRLNADAMTRAVASIQSLLADAEKFQPSVVRLVATSAVRDAANAREFASLLRTATNRDFSVLTGTEEARLIGRGIACDPALRGIAGFYLFDLGGGSLELLEFREGKVRQLTSLQLGCVRVTELCIPAPELPIGPEIANAVREFTRTTVARSQFRFERPRPATAIVTGGTATTFRAVSAAANGVPFADSNPVLSVDDFKALADRLGAMSIDQRRAVPGLSAARADVFPAALLTLVEVARLAGTSSFHHSLYNLRFGLAAELLELPL